MSNTNLIGTSEALAILGLASPASITHFVAAGRLAPVRKMPGRNGAFIFARADVEALAAERAA